MHDFDGITTDDLREQGSAKWTYYPETINAWVAEMDFGTAPSIVSALRSAVEQAQLGYLPPSVAANLSTACADWQRASYGWDLPAEHIYPMADVLHGLQVTIEHFSRPGSAVIVPTPAYMPFLWMPERLGRTVLKVPMLDAGDGSYAYDLEAIDAAFADGAGVLVVCNPHNPLGWMLTREEAVALGEVVARHGGRVFSDEIHAPLTLSDRRHTPYAAACAENAMHTVTATSASKGWNLAGTKCAQLLISNDEDASTLESVRFEVTHGASTLGAIANTAAYTAGRAWLAEVVDYLAVNRATLAALIGEHLPQAVLHQPEATYLAWIDCRRLPLPSGVSAADFFRSEALVSTTDGAACGAPGFVRFNFALPRPLLVQAVQRMGAAVR